MDRLKDLFSIEKRTKYFARVLVCLCLASAILFGMLVSWGRPLSADKKALAAEKNNVFENLALEGKGVMVLDVVNHRELFSKNPDLAMPLASLTKVLTALITDEKLDDDQKIEIKQEYLEPEGDSGLVVGDVWQVKDLRDFTLLTSSNDGAFALAGAIESQTLAQFIKSMNDTASVIGLSNSKFFNEHGLDRDGEKGGSYGSARDVTALFEHIMKNYPGLLEATRYKTLQFSSAQKTYTAENTNIVVDQIPNIIASKTGFTDLAGGNLVIAFDAGLNRPIIISILGSTQEGRFSDALKLAGATLEFINNE